jgi:putative redox protein
MKAFVLHTGEASMTVFIEGRYQGAKKVALCHAESGVTIETAAPKDNGGDGSSFSPTDLVAAAVGSCMVTIMGLMAERDGSSLAGTWFTVEKHMSASPRRIARLPVVIHLPKQLTPAERTKLERGAHTCPVAHSLHPDVKVEVTFCYDV